MNGTTDMTTAAMMLYPCILQCSMEFSIGNAFELVSSCSELPSCTAFYCLTGTLVRIYGTASSEEMRYHANGDLSMAYNFQGTDLTLYFSK